MANQFGVAALIKEVKETKGSSAYPFALEALGEAGGKEAVECLIEILKIGNRDDSTYKSAVKALGRASRN